MVVRLDNWEKTAFLMALSKMGLLEGVDVRVVRAGSVSRQLGEDRSFE